MGRSQLQGTPWHYEYNKGNGINNSKNCAYNTGDRCACRASLNHNFPCVGKLNCEEFERRNGRVPTLKSRSQKRQNKKSVSYNCSIKYQPKNLSKNTKKIQCVEIGSIITIKSQSTSEIIELGKITSKDNPFYSKEINSIVHVKGIQYKIIKIL